MESTDADTGIVSTTNFRQDFPFTGMVESTTTVLGTATLSQTTNSNFVDTTSAGGLSHFPQARRSIQEERELDNSPVKTVTTDSVYDDYGNPTAIVVTTAGNGQSFTKTTTNAYTNDEPNWFLGRLTSASVLHEHGTNPSITRTSSFDYDAVTGLLSKETIEPSSTDPKLRLTTAYGRDGYGHITTKTVCDGAIDPSLCTPGYADPLARTTTTTGYDYTNLTLDGTYSVTTTNAVGLTVKLK